MAIIRFIVFIILFLSLFLGTHYLIYTSAIRFLGIIDPTTRRIIFWVLLFFALSFFPSAILLRLHVNIATNLFYLISVIWMGLLIYILMALAVVWLFYGLGKIVGSGPDMRLVFIFFIMLAGLVAGYGIWRAQNPVLKHLEVEIKGLPEFWLNKVIVQLSDVHLGTIHRKAFMKKVVEEVNSVNPDLILITGDLFDGMGGKMPQFIEPLNSMRATQGKYFITGNHEGYLGLKRPLSVIKETDILILDNEVVDLEGLQVVGISYPEYQQENGTRNLLLDSGSYDSGKSSILLYHTPTSIEEEHTDLGSQQANTYWFPDTSMALAKEVGIDLQLSGHTHKGQLFPFGFLTKIIYKGYDYGLHRDGDFQIYITSGVGTWGPPMRLGAPPEIVVIKLI